MVSGNLYRHQAGIKLAEDITDDRAEDHERRDNNNGNQNKNQRIFHKALAFLFGWKQHGNLPPFFWIFRNFSEIYIYDCAGKSLIIQ